MFEGNASYLYVANVASGVADAGDPSGIAAGSAVFVKEDGTIEKGANTTDKLRIAKKLADGSMIYSPFIDMSTRRNVVGKSYVAPSQQVSYLGYNGTSGNLDSANSTVYSVNLEWLNSQFTYNNSPMIFTGVYETSASASQAELGLGLVGSINANLSRQPYRAIKAEVVGNGTVAAITGSSTITKVTKGLKGVSVYTKAVAADTTLTASTASVTDATLLNIPSSNGRTFTFDCLDAVSHAAYIGEESYFIADQATAADGSDNATALAALINAGSVATATTSTATVTVTYNVDFYALPPMILSDVDGTPTEVAVTIASGDAVATKFDIDGTTSSAASFNLTEAYEGTTGYIFDGTTAATNSGIATVTSYGIKFTGAENSKFDAVNDRYEVVSFVVDANDFTTATVTDSVEPSSGSGYGKEVANLEAYAQFLDKHPQISAYPRTSRREEVDVSGTYDIMSLEINDPTFTSPTTGMTVNHSFRIQIATKVALAGDDMDTVLGITV